MRQTFRFCQSDGEGKPAERNHESFCNYAFLQTMHSQPRFSFTSSTARPAASSAAMTSSFRLSMMPLAMKTASSAIRPGTAGARDMMALATMLAVMMSYLPLALSDRSPTRTVSLSATPLRAAFSLAWAMAVSETSGFILKNRQTGSRRFALLPVLVKRMKRQKSFSRKGKSTV